MGTTITAGKSRARRVTPCYLRVDMDYDDGIQNATFEVSGDTVGLASKPALWMFTAHTCPCCGLRERELLCSPNDSEPGQENFYAKYPVLKAVEAGGDTRGIGRVELAFQDGDVLSVGLECSSGDH